MSIDRVAIQEEYILPSKGKMEGVPEKITLRAMSLLDEKKRLASSGVESIVNLIKDCTLLPENFDPNKLCRFDLDFLMVMLRILTHGPEYNISVMCPRCGRTHSETINLNDLVIREVPEDFSSEFEIGPLPQSGDVLKVKMLNFEDLQNITEESKRILTKFKDYKGDPSEILNYLYKVTEVNGEKLKYVDLKAYVESMPANDSIYFDQVYNDTISNYGIDSLLSFSCSECGNEFLQSMPMNSEFFRPRFDITKR